MKKTTKTLPFFWSFFPSREGVKKISKHVKYYVIGARKIISLKHFEKKVNYDEYLYNSHRIIDFKNRVFKILNKRVKVSKKRIIKIKIKTLGNSKKISFKNFGKKVNYTLKICL